MSNEIKISSNYGEIVAVNGIDKEFLSMISSINKKDKETKKKIIKAINNNLDINKIYECVQGEKYGFQNSDCKKYLENFKFFYREEDD